MAEEQGEASKLVSYNESNIANDIWTKAVAETIQEKQKVPRSRASQPAISEEDRKLQPMKVIINSFSSSRGDSKDVCRTLYDESGGAYASYSKLLSSYASMKKAEINIVNETTKKSMENEAKNSINVAIEGFYKLKAEELVLGVKNRNVVVTKICNEIDTLIKDGKFDELHHMLTYFKQKDKGLNDNAYKTVRDHLAKDEHYESLDNKFKLSSLLMEYIYIPVKDLSQFRETHAEAIKAIIAGEHQEDNKDKVVAYIKDMVHNAPKLEESEKVSVVKNVTKKFLEIMRDNGFTDEVDRAIRDLNRGDLHNAVFIKNETEQSLNLRDFHDSIFDENQVNLDVNLGDLRAVNETELETNETLAVMQLRNETSQKNLISSPDGNIELNNKIYDLIKLASDGGIKAFGQSLGKIFELDKKKNIAGEIINILKGQHENKNGFSVTHAGKVDDSLTKDTSLYLALAKAGGTYLADFNKAIIKNGDQDAVKKLQKLAANILGDDDVRKHLPSTSIHELEKMQKINPTFEKLKQQWMDKTKPQAAKRHENSMESGAQRDGHFNSGKKGNSVARS